MNKQPIFDAVRTMLGRSFRRSEISALDRACDIAAGSAAGAPISPSGHRLGALSEAFESGNRGPGAVSGGHNDAGGVSYGVYQLASKTGTCAAFLRAEGSRWADRFGSDQPGSQAFSARWKAIAHADPEGFRAAQHAFIERTHYRPVIASVQARTGFDLDSRSDAVRDASWSCAVQHSGAARVLSDAVARADSRAGRDDPNYDRMLIEAIYDRRVAYVRSVADNPKLPPGTRRQLLEITRNRYTVERARALAMLEEERSVSSRDPSPLLAAGSSRAGPQQEPSGPAGV